MPGLIGVTLGLGIAEYGLLKVLNKAMTKHIITAQNGGALTLTFLLTLPHLVFNVNIYCFHFIFVVFIK